MAFKLANISGQAALVKGEHYYDLKTISNNALGDDTLDALNHLDELHRLNSSLDDTNPTGLLKDCLLYTSPSPRDATLSRMPSSA